MADKQLEATRAAAAFQKAVVRRSAAARVRRAAAVRARAGRRAVRAVRSAGRPRGQQPVVGGAHRRQAAGAGVSRRDGGRRTARRAVPLLQPRAMPRRGIATCRSRRGADCRRRGCSARGSPATASSASSRSGRRRSAPSSSRSIIPAPAICRRAGGSSVGIEWRELVEPHRLAFVVADARAARRTARGDQRPAARSGRAAPASGAGESAGGDLRRGAAADRGRRRRRPVRMTEQITNVMATQWVRGTDWAIAHARAFP